MIVEALLLAVAGSVLAAMMMRPTVHPDVQRRLDKLPRRYGTTGEWL